MRHPFWKWTQWASCLCIGLSGCLHGQDWRAAVSKPLTRPVADRRESTVQPKVIGPRRDHRTSFVLSTDSPALETVASPPVRTPVPIVIRTPVPIVSGPRPLSSKFSAPPVSQVTPSAIVARPPTLTASGMDGVSRRAAEAIQLPTTKDDAQPRGAKVYEAGFIPPPAPPAAPPTSPVPVQTSVPPLTAEPSPVVLTVRAPQPPANMQTPSREVFAEFERTIPHRKASVPQESAVPAEDDEIVVAPEREPITPQPLPMIIPAGVSVPVIQPGVPRSLPPVSAKELPDVTDTITTASELPDANLEQVARPRDVAVLVEQVFEDLRQRRLDQARQRTAWLKQIVIRRESALEETSAAKQSGVAAEPQRLHVDQNAVPVRKTPSDKLLDDDEFKNRP